MALRKGPFSVQWGANVVADIEELEFEYEADVEELETVQGKTYEVRGAIKASATLTLLDTDIEALAALLPQYFVASGDTLANGETVTNPDGAIDVVAASCSSTPVVNDLTIDDCTGTVAGRLTLAGATTEIDTVEFDKVRKVAIKFTGTAPAGSVITFAG